MIVESLKVLALNQTEKTAAMEAIVKTGREASSSPQARRRRRTTAMPIRSRWPRSGRSTAPTSSCLTYHGDIYSDVEADEFVDPGQGEKGRLLPSSQYARNEASKLMLSMRNCTSLDMLEQWGKAHREEIRAQPEKHAEAIREAYSELADELRNNAA